MKPLPDFLADEDIHVLHEIALEMVGGGTGLRDAGLLASALAMPQAGFGDQFLHEDIPAMAAAYLYHLIRNHPFIDGNKRVAMLACLTFLDINEYECMLDEDGWIALVMAVAEGTLSKDECIERLRSNCRQE
ncbi:MAG: type II toxin-antitoxin system death-on-curing family toxin [Armatimonadota bacterium]